MGEKALEEMSKWERSSSWNFSHKTMLLHAEVHYTDGDIQSAERSYEASIKAARDHRFLHHEALAYELHGVFCVENGMRDKGTTQLRAAIDRYRKWGALEVAKRVQLLVDSIAAAVDPTTC